MHTVNKKTLKKGSGKEIKRLVDYSCKTKHPFHPADTDFPVL